jgi:hypothetical protein
LQSPFHLDSRFRLAFRVQDGSTFSASCNARMLPGGCLERGSNEVCRGFHKSSRIRLAIHQKFGGSNTR